MQEVLFEIDSYKCTSKHDNLIAFSFEVALLLRVLRSAYSQASLHPCRLQAVTLHASPGSLHVQQ